MTRHPFVVIVAHYSKDNNNPNGTYIENKNADLSVKMLLNDLASIGICDKKFKMLPKRVLWLAC
jgi:hypothetical protein